MYAGNPSRESTHMSDTRRAALELHVIEVSTRAALSGHPEHGGRIRDRSHELLANLEWAVLNNGADPGLLGEIEAARHALWGSPSERLH